MQDNNNNNSCSKIENLLTLHDHINNLNLIEYLFVHNINPWLINNNYAYLKVNNNSQLSTSHNNLIADKKYTKQSNHTYGIKSHKWFMIYVFQWVHNNWL